MKNQVTTCIHSTTDSQIKLEEKGRKIIFRNPQRLTYKVVQVDGCTLKEGIKCDKLLLSADEQEERYVELKGVDVLHAIQQIETTIDRLGEFDTHRHAYVICTNVSPAYTTQIQRKHLLFKKKYKSELLVRERQLTVSL